MPIDNALDHLIDAGILGALLVITLIVIAFLYRENKKEREDRLVDLKEYTNEDRLFIAQIKETLENVLALLRGTQK